MKCIWHKAGFQQRLLLFFFSNNSSATKWHMAQKKAPSALDLNFLFWMKWRRHLPTLHILCNESLSLWFWSHHSSRIQSDSSRENGCESSEDAKNISHDVDLAVKAHSVIK